MCSQGRIYILELTILFMYFYRKLPNIHILSNFQIECDANREFVQENTFTFHMCEEN